MPKGLKDAQGRPVCGAELRRCACGHHQRVHAYTAKTKTHRGGCSLCPEGTCPRFSGVPHMQHANLSENGRCRLHGGKSLPPGPMHPRWKTGDHSLVRSLAPKVARDYVAALNDPRILSLDDEIAVTRALHAAALERVRDTSHAGPAAHKACRAVVKAWAAFEQAHDAGGDLDAAMTRVTDTVASLSNAIAAAQVAAEAREESRRVMVVLERLVTSENQQIERQYNMISAERAFGLRQVEQDIFLRALDEHEPNAETRDRIRRAVAAGLAQLVGRGDDPKVAAARGPVIDVEPADPAA